MTFSFCRHSSASGALTAVCVGLDLSFVKAPRSFRLANGWNFSLNYFDCVADITNGSFFNSC